MCVFITAGPFTKLCAWGRRRVEDMCYEIRRGLCVCVFITAGPITKLFAWGRRRVEDMCYERRRAEACVDESAHHALVNAGGNLKEIV